MFICLKQFGITHGKSPLVDSIEHSERVEFAAPESGALGAVPSTFQVTTSWLHFSKAAYLLTCQKAGGPEGPT